jgi:hypothetical protein
MPLSRMQISLQYFHVLAFGWYPSSVFNKVSNCCPLHNSNMGVFWLWPCLQTVTTWCGVNTAWVKPPLTCPKNRLTLPPSNATDTLTGSVALGSFMRLKSLNLFNIYSKYCRYSNLPVSWLRLNIIRIQSLREQLRRLWTFWNCFNSGSPLAHLGNRHKRNLFDSKTG